MLVQGPTLRDAACIIMANYDGYTPAKRFITIYIQRFLRIPTLLSEV